MVGQTETILRQSALGEHFTMVWSILRGETGTRGVHKWFSAFLYGIKFFFPVFWIRKLIDDYELRNTFLETYIVLKLFILIWLIYFKIDNAWAVFVAIYCLADLVQYFLGLVFLSHIFTKIPTIYKNFAHLGLNLLEITLAFCVLYFNFHAIGTWGVPTSSIVDIFYFSLVTFATVGYGDILPLNQVGKILVVLQIIVSFIFISIICSSFVSQLIMKEE